MRVKDVINIKGAAVVTIRSDATVTELVTLLGQHGIGAVVVSDAEGQIGGIVSERDIVRSLGEKGADILTQPVAALMTHEVHTCGFADDIAELAEAMTARRIRHVPVVTDGQLSAIISIGDVVKSRITELSDERNHLVGYLYQ